MAVNRSIVCGFVALASLACAAAAAELPSQNNKKSKPPEALKHCNVAGSPGVVAGNGVCVRVSGYISAQFSAGQIK